jgi:hypothetical protein
MTVDKRNFTPRATRCKYKSSLFRQTLRFFRLLSKSLKSLIFQVHISYPYIVSNMYPPRVSPRTAGPRARPCRIYREVISLTVNAGPCYI